MITRVSISVKILLLALLNVLLLAVVFLVFATFQFRFELMSFLFAPARERIISVSRIAALQLAGTPRANWSKLLNDYSTKYPAQFYLFKDDGTELAGAPVALPSAFARGLQRDPFAHRHEHRPPPPGPPSGERPDGHRGLPPPPFGSGPFMDGFRHGSMPDAPLQVTKAGSPQAYWIGVRVPVYVPDREDPIHATFVWRIGSLWTERFFFDYRPWLAVVGVIALVSAACWIPLIRGLTSAISNISSATNRIADGDFDVQLRVKRRDELGQLSRAIASMAERLAGYVHGQKRFLGDIAHELSSPIARMQMALAILEQRGDNSNYISDIREEVDHMATLVNELLMFSKQRLADQTAQMQSVPVADVISRAIEREIPEAQEIHVDVPPVLVALADPDYLFRAVSNVLRNAVRYAGEAGAIEVTARGVGARIQIRIGDHGPGLPENELQNVFRPFYRPEFARQRETGGTGLGLAIVRNCIEACGGHVECRNRVPHGLEVTMELNSAS